MGENKRYSFARGYIGKVGMSFYTKFFILILGMAVGAFTALAVVLPMKLERSESAVGLSLSPICTKMVENIRNLGVDNYNWELLSKSCLIRDGVIYFGVPNE